MKLKTGVPPVGPITHSRRVQTACRPSSPGLVKNPCFPSRSGDAWFRRSLAQRLARMLPQVSLLVLPHELRHWMRPGVHKNDCAQRRHSFLVASRRHLHKTTFVRGLCKSACVRPSCQRGPRSGAIDETLRYISASRFPWAVFRTLDEGLSFGPF